MQLTDLTVYMALLASVSAGTWATAADAAYVDTGFVWNNVGEKYTNNQYKPMDGNYWYMQLGTKSEISVASVNNAAGAATKVMKFKDTGDGWLPQAKVYLGKSWDNVAVNISDLSVGFDFYYVNTVPGNDASSFRVMLRDASEKAAAAVYLNSASLSANTWYHFSLVTSKDNKYTWVVTDAPTSAKVMAAANPVAFSASATGGLQNTSYQSGVNVAFQLGDDNGSTALPEVYLDNVKVDVAPVPESAALSILGVGIMALLMKRH